MAAGAIDQSNRRTALAAAAERVAEPRCQFQPSSAATDHDNLVQRCIHRLLMRPTGCRGTLGRKVSDDPVLGLDRFLIRHRRDPLPGLCCSPRASTSRYSGTITAPTPPGGAMVASGGP